MRRVTSKTHASSAAFDLKIQTSISRHCDYGIPKIETQLTTGDIAFRQHSSGHTPGLAEVTMSLPLKR